jgi:NAD(P)-dependent dehydrogenase (short-subunit alcohol dehydrogenase family)
LGLGVDDPPSEDERGRSISVSGIPPVLLGEVLIRSARSGAAWRMQVDSPGLLRLDGQVAVVTGAGRGLGRAFARELASRGASVVVNDIGVSADAARYATEAVPDTADDEGDPDATDVADRVAAEIVELGGIAIANRADISQEEGAASTIADAVENFGRVDAVVNNAGIVITGALSDLTTTDLRQALDVHVVGPFNVCRSAWAHMARSRYGRIVNVGSIAGTLFGVPGHSVYDAAKGALAGLTRSLAAEGGELGIHVNSILPTATTRSAASVRRSYERGPGFGAEAVAPLVTWLIHSECEVSGKFFAAGAGRVGEVATAASAGYQSGSPERLSAEEIREHWDAVCSRESTLEPRDAADFNAFRTRIREGVVSGDQPSEKGSGRPT